MSHPALELLDGRERALMAQLASALESQDRDAEERRIYDAYEEVHREYVSLLESLACADEALKRALFIQWFAVAEPSWLSGIRDVDGECQRLVLEELERRAAAGLLDEELLGMFASYFGIADFAFGTAEAYPQVHVLAERLLQAPLQLQRPIGTGRGQMGHYWNARDDSQLARLGRGLSWRR